LKNLDFVGFEVSGSKVVKRMGVGLALFFLIQCKNILTFPVYTRVLGKEGYGYLSLIMVTAGILFPLVKLVLSYGFRVDSVHLTDRIEIRRNFTTTLIPALFFSVINLGLFTLVDLSVIDPGLNRYKGLICILVFAMILKEYSQTLPETFQKARILATFTSVVEGTAAAAAIISVLIWENVAGVVIPLAAAYAIGGLVLLALVFRDIGFEWYVNPKQVKRYLRIGLPLIPVGFFLWVMQSLDQYFIAYYANTARVGIYAAGYGLAGFMLFINPALDFAFGATLVKLWNEKRYEEFYAYNDRALKWVILIIAVICGLGTILAVPGVRIIASETFIESATVLPILLASMGCFLLACVFQRLLYAGQKTMAVLIIYLLAALINLGLNMALIPKLQLMGAAYATLISYAFAMISLGLVSAIKYRYPFYRNRHLYMPLLVVGLYVGLASRYIGGVLLTDLAIAAGCVLVLAAAMGITGFVHPDERLLARQALAGLSQRIGGAR
jgi:O-antigen/teichoic acid export membrane protein